MKKGDESRQKILETAERLFCQRGYEATSVQDILDVLNSSKGSFYHHFPSKEAVLETLCGQRAESAAEAAERELAECTNALDGLNRLISSFLPLKEAQLDFIAMLLPILEMPEGRSVRVCYQESLAEAFTPLFERMICQGAREELICPAVKNGTSVLLEELLNQFWFVLCSSIIQQVRAEAMPSIGDIHELLERYRQAVERMLDAPYGSILLLRLEDLNRLITRTIQRIKGYPAFLQMRI